MNAAYSDSTCLVAIAFDEAASAAMAWSSGNLDTYYVRTYPVCVNVTLSIDEEILARARELAARRRTSVNQLIRNYLEEIVSEPSLAEVVEELDHLWSESAGDSGGRRWTREEVHERGRVS